MKLSIGWESSHSSFTPCCAMGVSGACLLVIELRIQHGSDRLRNLLAVVIVISYGTASSVPPLWSPWSIESRAMTNVQSRRYRPRLPLLAPHGPPLRSRHVFIPRLPRHVHNNEIEAEAPNTTLFTREQLRRLPAGILRPVAERPPAPTRHGVQPCPCTKVPHR